MKSASDIILKLLGILLLTAAVLKGWQLVTEPLPDKGLWSNRAFLIFTVEFELALSIWVLSGLFKKAAWLATGFCFLTFSGVTLYKALAGAASCGLIYMKINLLIKNRVCKQVAHPTWLNH